MAEGKKPDAAEFLERLAKEVHAAWRDGMLNQGRPVSRLRLKWETLDQLDHELGQQYTCRINANQAQSESEASDDGEGDSGAPQGGAL